MNVSLPDDHPGHLRDALLEGGRSPIASEADTAYFESLRDQAQANT